VGADADLDAGAANGADVGALVEIALAEVGSGDRVVLDDYN